VSADVEVDGIPVPSGATLLSPTQLKSNSGPAFVHLRIAKEVELTPSTIASFEALETGDVLLTVHAGTASYRAPNGEIIVVPEGSSEILHDDDKMVAALLPESGLSTLTKIGVGAGAAGMGGILIYVLDDDEEKPASRVEP
jgi:hypothetical protein